MRKALPILVLTATVMSSHALDPHAGPTMNHHRVDPKLVTGGHFVGEGLAQLAHDGVEVVVDLRPEDSDEHRARVEAAGLVYVHVPVSWTDPRPEDYEAFAKALGSHRDRHVLVQCAANYRASAMTYLFRTIAEGIEPRVAREDLLAVWEPEGRWQRYIRDTHKRATARSQQP